jgi:hypothetical protein
VTLLASVLVTAVVWAISLMPSVRLRAFVYSLPLPMTLVLAVTGISVDGSQFIGVALLVAFVGLVSFLHERCGWHILLADLGGIAGYVALSAVIGLLPTPPVVRTIVAIAGGWLVAVLVLQPWRVAGEPARPGRRLHPVAKLGVVFAAALLTTQVAALIRGLVVTFPYSGVLVVIETRHHLADFSRQFTLSSLGLVAFLVGFHCAQGHGRMMALVVAWTGYGVAVTLLTVAGALLAREEHLA